VRYSRPTKAPVAQIRRASGSARDGHSGIESGTEYTW
jgi:hypothetical protein